MTTTTMNRAMVVSPFPPSTPQVCLVPDRASQAVLDGGWWPRSTDATAEVPGLVLALGDRFGPIRQLMLSRDGWDSHPRRLAVGGRVVRLGWFVSVDPALIIATTERGYQIDLLVVPPQTPEVAARTAMAQAADPANIVRAPAILAAILAPVSRSVAATGEDAAARAAWDNEGGHCIQGRDRLGGSTHHGLLDPSDFHRGRRVPSRGH